MIKRLDHIIVAVQQLAGAATAWTRVFAVQPDAPYHPEGSHMELARVPLADTDNGGAFLELAQPANEQHRLARFIAERGEGMFSISLEVDDIDATVAQLRAKGLPVTDPEPGTWPGTRLARIPRAGGYGVAIQLIQRDQ